MTRAELEKGARRYAAMRRAGEGSLDFKVAQDFWLIWLVEHGLEFLNLARAEAGLEPVAEIPQEKVTPAPASTAMDRAAERVLAPAVGTEISA